MLVERCLLHSSCIGHAGFSPPALILERIYRSSNVYTIASGTERKWELIVVVSVNSENVCCPFVCVVGGGGGGVYFVGRWVGWLFSWCDRFFVSRILTTVLACWSLPAYRPTCSCWHLTMVFNQLQRFKCGREMRETGCQEGRNLTHKLSTGSSINCPALASFGAVDQRRH